MDLDFVEVKSPVGTIVLVEREGKLCAVDFTDHRERMMRLLESRFDAARLRRGSDSHGFGARMQRYLEGDLTALHGVPVDTGGTPFQQKVWNELRKIPVGQTRSYGQLAASIGKPRAVRAVGTTNARNPVGIVIPCHRVIGADGSLTGYAGGIERKRWLLAHEGVRIAPSPDVGERAGR